MSYLEEIKSGKKTFVFLAKSLRMHGKVKKARVLLGVKPVKNLEKLCKSKESELESRIEDLKGEEDEIYGLLKDPEKKELNLLAERYSEAFKKFDPVTKQKYLDWFLTQFTYDSNAIEGSNVPLEEVGMILFDKVVPADRDLREVYEVQNHKEAFDFINRYGGDLNLKFILAVHKRLMTKILRDAGKIRDVRVFVRGSDLKPPDPKDVEHRLKTLVNWYKAHKSLHPVILASYVHCEFERTHPFRDGNGRTGRLIMNYLLTKNGFPPVNIRNEKKRAYYGALRDWDKGYDKRAFVDLVVSYIKDSVDYVTKS
ncbi:MAG: Fic family protein [Candidatus Altiarchaeota archaeon]|nr:Fic family protein [Candidatus Altiarchaeota archaeon]